METTPVELLTLPTGPWPGMHTLLIEISTDPLSSGGMKTLWRLENLNLGELGCARFSKSVLHV